MLIITFPEKAFHLRFDYVRCLLVVTSLGSPSLPRPLIALCRLRHQGNGDWRVLWPSEHLPGRSLCQGALSWQPSVKHNMRHEDPHKNWNTNMPRQEKNSSAYPGMDFKPPGRSGIQEMFYLQHLCRFKTKVCRFKTKVLQAFYNLILLLFPEHDLV